MRAHQRSAPVVVALLLLVPVLPSLAQPAAETRLYIGHHARLTSQPACAGAIPAASPVPGD